MSKIKLKLPIKDIYITQPFGVNYLNFYQKLGMRGHNGIDFRARRGCPILASHDGKVIYSARDGGGGISVVLWNKEKRYKTIYYHNLKNKVRVGQKIKAGKIIALADNTGKYTTGNHLHMGFKFTDENGATINKKNGYNGAVDHACYFKRNWNKSNAYHRYGRERSWLAEYWLRFAPNKVNNQWANSGRWIHRQLSKMGVKPPLSGEQINALIYGGWDFGTVINPSMYVTHWGWLTKTEFKNGDKPFCR